MTKQPIEFVGRIDKARSQRSIDHGHDRCARAFRAMGVEMRGGTRRGRGIELYGARIQRVRVIRRTVCRKSLQSVWAPATRAGWSAGAINERSETARARRNGRQGGRRRLSTGG